jgi:hypothetical protein
MKILYVVAMAATLAACSGGGLLTNCDYIWNVWSCAT